MKGITLLTTLLMATSVHAKTITVAVVDTGFDMKGHWERHPKLNVYPPKICKFGHWNFVSNNDDVTDNHGHGTHIAGIIAQGNENVDYCLVVMKYYDPKVIDTDNLKNTVNAFKRAVNIKVDVINYSGGGTELSKDECAILKKALDQGIKVVAAAGNERSNLDEHPYYPALCDPRIIVVENRDKEGNIPASSNYTKGKYRTYAAVGVNVLSTLPDSSYGYMTGTSQSTAIITSDIVRQLATRKMQRTQNICCGVDYVSQLLCEYKYKGEIATPYTTSLDLRKYESRKRKEAK